MDQSKVGAFLKVLRKEKDLTQEAFAEIIGVTSRTVSRWENGNSMPDIDILIEISDFYAIDIKALLEGKRRSEDMDKDLEKTVLQVAEYNNEETLKMTKKVNRSSLLGIFTMIIYLILVMGDIKETPLNDFISGMMLGISLATMIMSDIHTIKYRTKVLAFKRRIIGKVE